MTTLFAALPSLGWEISRDSVHTRLALPGSDPYCRISSDDTVYVINRDRRAVTLDSVTFTPDGDPSNWQGGIWLKPFRPSEFTGIRVEIRKRIPNFHTRVDTPSIENHRSQMVNF